MYSHDILDDNTPCNLTYAVLNREGETHRIDCLCSHVIETSEDQKEKYKTSFLTVLEWITVTSGMENTKFIPTEMRENYKVV